MKRLQFKRFAAKGRSVYSFSLLVRERVLDDLYDKFRAPAVYVIVRVIEIAEKSLNGLFQFLTGYFPPAAYAFGVLFDGWPVPAFNPCQALFPAEPPPAFPRLHFSAPPRTPFCMPQA